MKVQAQDLFKVMRQVVQEELKKTLPGLIRKHLSEQYARRIVTEAGQVGQVSQAGITGMLANPDEDEQEIPSPPENDHKGVYDASNPALRKNEQRERNNAHMNKLMARNNPLAAIYEGVKMPGDEDETPSIPLEALGGPDFEKMNKMLEGMEQVATQKAPMSSPSYEAKMKELERKRAALEVPIR